MNRRDSLSIFHNAAGRNKKIKTQSTQRIHKEHKENLCELCVNFVNSVLKIFTDGVNVAG